MPAGEYSCANCGIAAHPRSRLPFVFMNERGAADQRIRLS
jgi:hypothetical protein